MAITDRTGDDTRPIVLKLEHTTWDCMPLLGTLVCAVGNNGWRYIGQVISTDEIQCSYTIEVFTANNKILDNLKQYHNL